MHTRYRHIFLALMVLASLLDLMGPSTGRAQEQGVAQVLSVVKALEARVAALEDQNARYKREAEQARAETRALRRGNSAEPISPADKQTRPVLASQAYAMATKAPAASRPASAPIVPDPWSGPYWGASFGGALTRSRVASQDTFTANNSAIAPPLNIIGYSTVANTDGGRNAGATLDAFVGVNFKLAPDVLGGMQLEGTLSELDFNAEGTRAYTYFDANGPTGQTAAGAFRPHVHARWMVSALGRVGVLVEPSTLAYAIAGMTIARFDYQNITDNLFFQPGERYWAVGWSAGGGIERKIDQNWSVRAEYRYTRFRDVDVSNNFSWSTGTLTQANAIQTRFENEMHVGRLGFSYLPSGK
jgi:outer membrane immunogenic protein